MNKYVVSREDLAYNLRILQEKASGVPIWAVVKANGYGLGAGAFAKELWDPGIRHFCVTELSEARAIRQTCPEEAQILMLRQVCMAEEIRELLQLGVILTVGSLDAAERISAVATEPAQIHLKVDVGMGRYGFLFEEVLQMEKIFTDYSNLEVKGIYTHFPCAFCDESTTRSQFAEFNVMVGTLTAKGYDLGTVHCCNSSAFLKFPHMHLGGVRLGSALLGRMAFPTKLRPLGVAESMIEELRHLPEGHSTGYGSIWRAKKGSVLAIVPVGWVHGFRMGSRPDRSRWKDCLRGMLEEFRNLLKRPKTMVQINGRSCPVVGVVGSLHCAVDVTGLNCKIGDKVLLPVNPMYVKNMEVEFR